MTELPKLLCINREGEIVSRIPFTGTVERNRSVSWFKYLKECEAEGKSPSRSEWERLHWESEDEGPRAS